MENDHHKNLPLKHNKVTSDPAAAEAIEKAAKEKKLTCADAHRIAGSLGIEPSEMGVQIDLLDHAITRCQLGLFGYDDGKKGFDPDIDIRP